MTATLQDVEIATVEAVASGALDLGWIGARAFTAMGVTDFDALTTPMLIDSYPLQSAILESDIPARMLPGVEEPGIHGLAVMGGGLRVPSGVNEPFLGVDTYSDTTFHAFRSDIGVATITALGAIHTDVVPEERDTGLSDGSIDGYENTVPFHAIRPALSRHVTANVVLWPAFGVLVASPETLAQLGDQQNGWLLAAAAETAASSVDLISDDSESRQEICDLGGSVYEASEPDIASLREALQPVYDQLMNDSDTAKFIAEVDEIQESIGTEPVAIPEGCADGATAGESDPRLPDGTYTTEELTAEDAVAALRARGVEIEEQMSDAIDSQIGDQTYMVSYVFDGGEFVQRMSKDGGPAEVGSSGTYEVLDDTTLELFETCCGTSPIEFSFDGQALDLRLGFEDDEVQAVCDEQPLDCFGIVVIESGTFFSED